MRRFRSENVRGKKMHGQRNSSHFFAQHFFAHNVEARYILARRRIVDHFPAANLPEFRLQPWVAGEARAGIAQGNALGKWETNVQSPEWAK